MWRGCDCHHYYRCHHRQHYHNSSNDNHYDSYYHSQHNHVSKEQHQLRAIRTDVRPVSVLY